MRASLTFWTAPPNSLYTETTYRMRSVGELGARLLDADESARKGSGGGEMGG